MSEITAAIDRFRRDVEQIENGQATTLRERGHQIGRIVTAFQGILEEFTTSVTHIQKELETVCETAKVKQIQLFTSLLDLQASIEYESQRLSALAQEIPEASQSATPSLEQLRNDSMVIESTDFTESKRRHKLAQIASGAR
jgi:t-SNARE complex subunit (syntaxin)